MEDEASQDLLGNVVRPSSVRVSRSFRGSRSSPTSSPSFSRRAQPGRTPRKDDDASSPSFLRWFSRYSSRRLPWLMLIMLWILLVLKMYSRGPAAIDESIANEDELRKHVPLNKGGRKNQESVNSGLSRLAREWIWTGYLRRNNSIRTSRSKKPSPANTSVQDSKREPQLHARASPINTYEYVENFTDDNFKRFQSLQAGDYFLGRVVGPYSKVEQSLLNASESEGRSCRGREFEDFVSGKRFVVLMHELSMTGSPLAMMELASEVVCCGGKVSVVVLDRRGGLLNELARRKIPVVSDKAGRSWRAAAKAHLVVAGSAICASWIDSYLKYNTRGASRVVWWIMENRREYFERAKRVLGKVGALAFLTRIQAEQWEEWSLKENVTLPSHRTTVSLSVNDAIPSAAGLFDETGSIVSKLREEVRSDMGLQPDDTLFATLSSINPGKGQLLILHAAAALLERNMTMKLLIGSVGSKSNKQEYVDKMLRFLHQNPALSKCILWTPASVYVSGLYAAADVYIMNAQGVGETFGRVTVEAMSFGLPILGTDAGGTKEVVDANSSGYLHPIGLKGAPSLAENMQVLLSNSTMRNVMGRKGRGKVQALYTKSLMYTRLALFFKSCCL